MATLTEARIKKSLADLNANFRGRSLVSSPFYRQLEGMGFDIERSILVSLIPDGGNTFIGKIFRQDGCLFDFDIDVELPVHSVVNDVTHFLKESSKTSTRDRLRIKIARSMLDAACVAR